MNEKPIAGGELTWEIFETVVKDDPELLLADFLRSNHENFFLVIPNDDDTFFMANITQRTATQLLKERAISLLRKE